MKNQGNSDALYTKCLDATRRIQKPAGDDPRFSTIALIKKNAKELALALNKTYKALHYENIGGIIAIEQMMRDPRTRPDTSELRFLDYLRSILRRQNDSMVWVMAGHRRHVIKRACAYRDRTWLDSQDVNSALKFLKKLNEDPLTLAIWNDATSCIDLADFTSVTWPNTGLHFLELKTGKVNADLMKTPPECGHAINFAFQKYGQKGLKQLQRMLRQRVRAEKILRILKDDTGEDPDTGETITLIETDAVEAKYDSALRKLISAAEFSGDSISQIDGCLWIYARNSRDIPDAQLPKSFLEKLKAHGTDLSDNLYGRIKDETDLKLISLQDGFLYRYTTPIFLRGLSPETITNIVLGRCVVMFYFDWIKFADLLTECGAEFSWSTEKEGRRQFAKPESQRMLLIKKRVPKISKGEAHIFVGAPTFLMMPFDGRTPRSIALNEVALLDGMLAGKYFPGRPST